MIMLVGTVATIGYRALVNASDAFSEYRIMSRLNVLFSDILADQYAAAGAIRLFSTSLNAALMEEARNYIKASQAIAEQARSYTTYLTAVELLNTVQQRGNRQIEIINGIERATLTMMKQYEEEVLPASRALSAMMTEMLYNFIATGNERGARAAAAITDDLTTARSAVSQFAYSRTQENGDRSLETVNIITKNLEPIRAALNAGSEHKAFAQVQKAQDLIQANTSAMVESARESERLTLEFLGISGELLTAIRTTSSDIDASMTTQGKRTLQANETAEAYMLGVTVAGLIIGALLAVFIIWGLVRTLNNVRNLAEKVSNGDFNPSRIPREPGEFGAMIASIRKIPDTLQVIFKDIDELAKRVKVGELDATADQSAYKGGFAEIIRQINLMLGLYLEVIEKMPNPVLMMDKERHFVYLNKNGRELCGEDYKGKKGLMHREDSGTPADAAAKALETLKPASNETRAHPQSRPIDIFYTSIPLLTADGKFCCLLQIFTDLTTIKETQRTIKQVAEQASAIAGRVAASSEELSAQVEQVSRGAEMQRTRVESTATAMTEMNSTVLEVAKNAGDAAEQAEATRNKASDGAELVDKVVHSINLVNKVAATLQKNMQDLGTKAESIGGVMNVISDIADQTNLLALNAAIEAARAGEAGRGFAVVADEVRKLAEKTMSATQEVGANITAIQQSAHTNIKEVGEAAKAVTEATDLANTSGQALTEIVNLAATNSSVAASIATAAEEQSATSEEINQSIEEISRIVADTSDGMAQAAQAVQDLAHTAQELNRVMGELR